MSGGEFTYTPAARENVPLLFGLVGPSGGGKTYSALRLATGMGGEIAVIDTEGRRALHYADKFRFNHVPFGPPFSGARYLEAINFCLSKGARNVVIDSMSHEHEGEGGHLAQHDAELDRMAGNDFAKRKRMTWTAWIKPKQDRRLLVNGILQATGANFLFCFRAKEKLKLVTGRDPVPLGWQAIAGDELVFEMTARCVLPPAANGVPDWSEESSRLGGPKMTEDLRTVLRPGRVLDEQVGAELAAWASGKATATATNIPENIPVPSIADAEQVAGHGIARLQSWWQGLSADAKRALAPEKDRLKKLAEAADLADGGPTT